MLMTYVDILDKYVSDKKLSSEIISIYQKYMERVSKYDDFKIEEMLKQLPYLERLKTYSLQDLETLENWNLSQDFKLIVMYLLIRSTLSPLMTIHFLTIPVRDHINTSFLNLFPTEIPYSLKNGIYIKAKKHMLFDNVTEIILYTEHPSKCPDCFGIILFHPDGTSSYASLLYSNILGNGIDEIDKIELKGKSGKLNAKIYRKALMFCFIFSIMLEAENTPATLKDTKKSTNLKNINTENKDVKKISNGWIERTVYLNEKYEKNNMNLIHATLFKGDKLLQEIKVSGFYRLQACGKNFSERKIIHISSHISYRWVTEGDKKVTYYLKEK